MLRKFAVANGHIAPYPRAMRMCSVRHRHGFDVRCRRGVRLASSTGRAAPWRLSGRSAVQRAGVSVERPPRREVRRLDDDDAQRATSRWTTRITAAAPDRTAAVTGPAAHAISGSLRGRQAVRIAVEASEERTTTTRSRRGGGPSCPAVQHGSCPGNRASRRDRMRRGCVRPQAPARLAHFDQVLHRARRGWPAPARRPAWSTSSSSHSSQPANGGRPEACR